MITAEVLIYLDGDVSFRDLSHIEPDCRDHVFTEVPRLNGNTQVLVIYNKAALIQVLGG